MTRRTCLSLAATAPFFARAATTDSIAQFIHEFELQGNHRTGTPTDQKSGEWLMSQVGQAGREEFTLNRVDPVACSVTIDGRRMDGLPLFDGGFTGPDGIRGGLGDLNSPAPIGLTETAPNAAGPLREARRQNRHQAIVVLTRGGRPGLCPSNAENFLTPFGPPVVQVSSEDAGSLLIAVKRRDQVTLIANVKRTPAQAFNVTARVPGSNPALPPLIVMTPRSGWWTCASERGGGLVCWLWVLRAMRAAKPARDVLFVASSGHEVGYLGIEAFVANRPGIAAKAHAWIHLGANIGAAQSPSNTIQASDDDMERLIADGITAVGMRVDRRIPRGTVPGGEAGVVHRGRGRYLSLIGGSALFHNPADRGESAVDLNAIAKFADAFTAIAKTLASEK